MEMKLEKNLKKSKEKKSKAINKKKRQKAKRTSEMMIFVKL
jgi:hypothetical protein